MPKIRRNLPEHLLERIRSREIPIDQLRLLDDWMNTDPEAPAGEWVKEFPKMMLAGEGEFPKTFLRPGQVARGQRLP